MATPRYQLDSNMRHCLTKHVHITIGQEYDGCDVFTSAEKGKEMSKPVTRRRKPAARRNKRPMGALRRCKSAPTRAPIGLRKMSAQAAWAAAGHARKAVQDRIVRAFRNQLHGSGPGPSDVELLMFARLAVAEQRLGRRLAQTKVAWRCSKPQTPHGPASVLRRGEHP